DIIFFRNVLIYFNEETTRRLINAFYDMLSDGGYLFLGPSETLWEMSDKFELLMFENAYIYRKKGKAERAQSKAEPPAAPPVSTKPTISTTSTTPTTTSPTPPTPPPPPAHPSFPSTESAGIRQQSPAPAPPPAIFPDIGDKIRIQQEEAVLMIELGDYGKAGKIVEELLKLNPGNKRVILLKMTLLINQSLEEELFDYLTQVNRLHPIFLERHFLLGRYYESKEEIRKAIQEYNKVLFIDQECLQAREGLLRLYNNRGETVNAQREARNILEQLSSGNYKEFEFNVGETVSSIKDRLEKFCTQILS
ncbi:MAG: hypothetical protein GY757_28700, partial [bacterium]|nr:hypothetical protein [bacterium]